MNEQQKTNIGFLLLAAAAMCAVLPGASCNDNMIYEHTWRISGTVTDSLAGQPLDSVRIDWGDTVTGVPTFTDS